VKPGVRALGIAESFRGREGTTSTLCGVLTRASRVTDGFVFGSCTVGGTDGTDAVRDLHERLDREDVRYVMLSGIALAWYNVLDLRAIHETVDRPVCSITYEESENGLEAGLRETFSGPALEERLATYRRQPPRRPIDIGGETLFVRSVGLSEGEEGEMLRAFTPEGGRPEPLRVARLAARAADQWTSKSRSDRQKSE
jgi:endonuclease V-like protein UPF0215 family